MVLCSLRSAIVLATFKVRSILRAESCRPIDRALELALSRIIQQEARFERLTVKLSIRESGLFERDFSCAGDAGTNSC